LICFIVFAIDFQKLNCQSCPLKVFKTDLFCTVQDFEIIYLKVYSMLNVRIFERMEKNSDKTMIKSGKVVSTDLVWKWVELKFWVVLRIKLLICDNNIGHLQHATPLFAMVTYHRLK
jgi:hypothetical protein